MGTALKKRKKAKTKPPKTWRCHPWDLCLVLGCLRLCHHPTFVLAVPASLLCSPASLVHPGAPLWSLAAAGKVTGQGKPTPASVMTHTSKCHAKAVTPKEKHAWDALAPDPEVPDAQGLGLCSGSVGVTCCIRGPPAALGTSALPSCPGFPTCIIRRCKSNTAAGCQLPASIIVSSASGSRGLVRLTRLGGGCGCFHLRPP